MATYDEAYSDLKADVVLVSKGGMRHRMHSYVLKTYSTVFRDMLETGNIGSSVDKNGEPLPVDASSSAVHDLLDLMTKPQIETLLLISPYEELWKLCDLLGCEILHDRICTLLRKNAHICPWPVFCIASKVNDLDLAKVALAHLGKGLPDGSLVTFDTLTAAHIAQVDPKYLLPVLRFLPPSAVSIYGRGSTYCSASECQWEAFAKTFQPVD